MEKGKAIVRCASRAKNNKYLSENGPNLRGHDDENFHCRDSIRETTHENT